MNNPNITVHYLPQPYPSGLTNNWRKYLIQASTANDLRLDFTTDQKKLIPKVDMKSYDFAAYPKPYTTLNSKAYGESTDICFGRFYSPNFSLWLEKIKICLHQSATYGCVKVNVWDFGTSITSMPRNLAGLDAGQPDEINVPVSIFAENKLISNVIDDTDTYMSPTGQVPLLRPFVTDSVNNIIAPNSLLRFGIQYAEGNAYGLKVFLVCWALECDSV